ncbi:hypothetical protein [Timonella senegalensis]|uniref:hypothetical protein n=1 Tax=Timonella senegalensis TaxID=1465825 RepID=UPI0002D42EB8|nr:hypothetical protein [Timonella senegalensis]
MAKALAPASPIDRKSIEIGDRITMTRVNGDTATVTVGDVSDGGTIYAGDLVLYAGGIEWKITKVVRTKPPAGSFIEATTNAGNMLRAVVTHDPEDGFPLVGAWMGMDVPAAGTWKWSDLQSWKVVSG